MILDPLREYKERKFVNTWTESEKEIFKEKFLLSFAGVCGVPGVCGVLGVVGVLRGDELRLLADLESASIAWRTIQIGYRKIILAVSLV